MRFLECPNCFSSSQLDDLDQSDVFKGYNVTQKRFGTKLAKVLFGISETKCENITIKKNYHRKLPKIERKHKIKKRDLVRTQKGKLQFNSIFSKLI